MTAPDLSSSGAAPRAPSRKGRADEKDTALGSKLRILRKAQKLTLHEMARLFGISAQQVQKYEMGEDRLSAVRLIELCRMFQFGLHQFTDDYIQSSAPALHVAEDQGLAYQAPPVLSGEEKKLLDIFRLIDDAKARDNVLQLVKNLADTKR